MQHLQSPPSSSTAPSAPDPFLLHAQKETLFLLLFIFNAALVLVALLFHLNLKPPGIPRHAAGI